MHRRNLISFGDSFPEARNLKSAEISYGQIIANRFNLSYQNLSVGGSSIDHLLIQITEGIKNNICKSGDVALFSLTESSRSIYFDPSPVSMSVMFDKQVKPEKSIQAQYYYKYLYSDELANFRNIQTIATLQLICSKYAINDFYISNFRGLNLDFISTSIPFIDKTKIYIETILDILDLKFPVPNTQYMDETTHPNALGHKKIAEELIKWINFQ